ncbi:MAG TPA: hypothetical protein EYG51_08825 [Pseudomonadales bacterium]|nr:hypothetical protein [Pseudomonadales bacterium]
MAGDRSRPLMAYLHVDRKLGLTELLSYPNIFQAMSDAYSKLLNASDPDGAEPGQASPVIVQPSSSKFVGSNVGKTRYHGLSSSSQLWLIFEIFFKLVTGFKQYWVSYTSWPPAYGSVEVRIRRLNEVNQESRQAITSAIRGHSSAERSDAFVRLWGALSACNNNMDVIRKLVRLLEQFGASLREDAHAVKHFFRFEDLDTGMILSHNQEILRDLSKIREGRAMLSMLSAQQLMLYRHYALTMTADVEKSPSYLPAARLQTSTGERRVVNSVLRAPRFGGIKATNVRTLVVGLPHNMMASLNDPPPILVDYEEQTRLEVNGFRKDVLKINIYKRDPQYPAIRFKPISFLFDPTLFLDSSSFNFFNMDLSHQAFNVRLPHDGLWHAMVTKMFEDGSSIRLKASELAHQNPYQDFVNLDDVNIMLHNHLVDYVLKHYYDAMFGLSLNEFTMPISDDVSGLRVDPDGATTLSLAEANDAIAPWITTGEMPIASLIREAPFGEEPGRWVATLNDVASLTSPSNAGPMAFQTSTEEVEPALITMEQLNNFRLLCSSNLFRPVQMKRQIMTPKLFERIFMIPVDPDDFIIDRDAMSENMSSTEMSALIGGLSQRGILEDAPEHPGEKRFRTRNLGENYVTTSEFFVTTEAGYHSDNSTRRFIMIGDIEADVELMRESARDANVPYRRRNSNSNNQTYPGSPNAGNNRNSTTYDHGY